MEVESWKCTSLNPTALYPLDKGSDSAFFQQWTLFQRSLEDVFLPHQISFSTFPPGAKIMGVALLGASWQLSAAKPRHRWSPIASGHEARGPKAPKGTRCSWGTDFFQAADLTKGGDVSHFSYLDVGFYSPSRGSWNPHAAPQSQQEWMPGKWQGKSITLDCGIWHLKGWISGLPKTFRTHFKHIAGSHSHKKQQGWINRVQARETGKGTPGRVAVHGGLGLTCHS